MFGKTMHHEWNLSVEEVLQVPGLWLLHYVTNCGNGKLRQLSYTKGLPVLDGTSANTLHMKEASQFREYTVLMLSSDVPGNPVRKQGQRD